MAVGRPVISVMGTGAAAASWWWWWSVPPAGEWRRARGGGRLGCRKKAWAVEIEKQGDVWVRRAINHRRRNSIGRGKRTCWECRGKEEEEEEGGQQQ